MEEKLIIGEDNICPKTGLICDDECCPPGAECNLSDEISDCTDAILSFPMPNISNF